MRPLIQNVTALLKCPSARQRRCHWRSKKVRVRTEMNCRVDVFSSISAYLEGGNLGSALACYSWTEKVLSWRTKDALVSGLDFWTTKRSVPQPHDQDHILRWRHQEFNDRVNGADRTT